jgi:chromosome segregation ATPase
MNIVKGLVALFLLVALVSCENKTEKEIEEIDKVLREGHDKVMPQSMKIGNIKKELLSSVETASDSLKNQANDLAQKLQKSEDEMYTWMEDYGKALNEVQDKEEKLKIYKSLKEQIEKIKKETEESIDAAKKFTESPK